MLRPARATLLVVGSVLGVAVLAGCTRDGKYQPLGMWDRARLKPMEASPRPNDTALAREPVPGTIAVGQLQKDDPVATGRRDGKLLTTIPIDVTPDVLMRGQERYNVYCSSCHGKMGDGQGMVVGRGFPPPPDYAIPRLRQAAVGHFFDVQTHGYGVMYSQAQSVPVTDRWAIAAYIRVLQKQRPVVPKDLTYEERRKAREKGIPDPQGRPMPVEEHGAGHGADAGHGGAPH